MSAAAATTWMSFLQVPIMRTGSGVGGGGSNQSHQGVWTHDRCWSVHFGRYIIPHAVLSIQIILVVIHMGFSYVPMWPHSFPLIFRLYPLHDVFWDAGDQQQASQEFGLPGYESAVVALLHGIITQYVRLILVSREVVWVIARVIFIHYFSPWHDFLYLVIQSTITRNHFFQDWFI